MQLVDSNLCNEPKTVQAITWRGLDINVQYCKCHLPLPSFDGSEIKFIELAMANFKKDPPGISFGAWWRLHMFIYALEMNNLIGRVNNPATELVALHQKEL